MELDGGVAVVTGGARGIGASLARGLVDAGMAVVVADIDSGTAEETASSLRNGGARARAISCDVGLLESVESLAKAVWDEFGRVDLLVNNAGVSHPPAPAIDLTPSDARWVLETNVMGVWHGCSSFGRLMVEQSGEAHIVNVASEHSLGVPLPGQAMYTASKHAILGLSDVLRRELPDRIGVSVAVPGSVQTEFIAAVRNRPERFGGAATPMRDRIPVGMTADEVAVRIISGVRAGDFYIATHPPAVELAGERWREISSAFDRHAPRFDGDELLDTRELVRRREASAASAAEGVLDANREVD